MEWKIIGAASFIVLGIIYANEARDRSVKWFQRLFRVLIATFDFWIALDWLLDLLRTP